MNKKAKYAITGGIIGGASLGIINAVKQLNDDDPNKRFDWGELILSVLGGMAVGGAVGFGVGAYKDYKNKMEKPINTDEMLLLLSNQIKLDKKSSSYQSLSQKADWLTDLLQSNFSDKIKKAPYRFGSTEMGTALNDGFDIDICLPFRPGTFSSTGDMFHSVSGFLEGSIGVNGITKVRVQKKSIGVYFSIKGVEQKIDILPKKLSSNKRNATSGYLFVNNDGLFEKPSRTKTDVALLNSVTLTKAQTDLMVLLKDLKKNEGLPMSSHLLQNLMLDAYDCNRGSVPRGRTKRLIMVLGHIKDNIEHISLSSIENTNNVLTDISQSDKASISRTCNKIIEEYKYQPNSILNYFR